ncbi:MAG: valine--tRNA ligase [Patescibacteria group bacterium]|jgi:valyl-tRNA synthetase
MAKEMQKAYEPRLVEDEIYDSWLKSGYFTPENLPNAAERKEVFSVVMPPPNVTGVLHLGHALEHSLMDAMVRYQRLLGKKVLLVPGTDHAAIATQAKVEKKLMAEGMKNPRQELGREALLEKIREFAESSKATILNQVKKMGTSADWSRLAYTFDNDRNAAVNELFTRMYNDGLIYRGFRVVNWSVKGQSTCSDDEIVTIEREATLYTFTYGKDFPISISTTRPETKVGDTAVAVHPADDRYKEFVGKTFDVEFAGSKLSIKVIASDEVDPEFGTGALGVTPAHSAIDFGMYEVQKAKQDVIEIKQVIGIDGKMTVQAGSMVAGMTVEAAREAVVAWLKEHNLLEKEEVVPQNVGTSDRYGDVIEAIPMTQWWLDVNKEIPGRGKTLRDFMREAVTTGLNGNIDQKVTITPDRFTKLYLDRIENLRDWCLSRQIWWGHRIPAWYRNVIASEAKQSTSGDENMELYVGTVAPEGEGWTQDEDTLDTWFSSGSWTFSTLGWPKNTADLETYHPTSWMQMGYEILYLWLMRMILMSTYAVNQIPFKDAYIHGILRDKDGKKFSKSSGNGIDPIEVINEYGCDALRISVLSGITPGNDSRYYTEKVESARNLVNKLWNISRFIFTTSSGARYVESVMPKTLADKWILARFSETTQKVGMLMDRYDFSLAIEVLRDFTWNDFADWYLEIAKIEKGKEDILLYILQRLLVLWHPFAPFVTEEIYKNFDSGMIVVAEWPKVAHELSSEDADAFERIQEIVIMIRNMKSEQKLPASGIPAVSIFSESQNRVDLLLSVKPLFERLGRCDIRVEKASAGEMLSVPEVGVGVVSRQVGDVSIYMALGEVDFDKEKTRLSKEIVECEKFIAMQESKLANEDFVKRAPEKVIGVERQKLSDLQEKYGALKKEQEALVS